MTVETSKKLSYWLRHHPEEIGIKLDKEGWTSVEQLILNSNISMEEIEATVLENDKQRFAFNADKTKIRANQGHSTTNVVIAFTEKVPPEHLYHGTATKNLPRIRKEGIKKMNRHHVHLSQDCYAARRVGIRHGKPCVLCIDTVAMLKDGIKFFITENDVWLTEYVHPKYILAEL